MERSVSCSRAWVEVDLGAIRSNVAEVGRVAGSGARIMAVVKADAYGHGLLPAATAVVAAGSSWLGVATVGEGAILRGGNISRPIALLSAPAVADAPDIVQYGLTALIGDSDILDALHASSILSSSRLAVHLDIDTGMGRSGVLPDNAVNVWRHAQDLGISIDGISTHFADADGADNSHTLHQIREFDRACAALRSAGANFAWIHVDNSSSISAYRPNTPPLGENSPVPMHSIECNLVRPGLLIYGITPKSPIEESIQLQPAMALKARIATIRKLPANHAISYGVTHRLTRDSRVATVSIGYGDGYARALSNVGHVLVRGIKAPILGSVCMDQTVVDVSEIPAACAGDEVVCIGRQHNETITVEQIARSIGATAHEVTTGLTARLPRVYLG